MQYYNQDEEALQVQPPGFRIRHPPEECFSSPTSPPHPAKAALTEQQGTCGTAAQSFQTLMELITLGSTEIVAKAFSKKEGEKREHSLETLWISSIYSQQNLTVFEKAEKNNYKKFRHFS